MVIQKTSVCEQLAWDSEFFGFQVARVVGRQLTAEKARSIDAWCLENGIRCLYFLADPDDARTTFVAQEKNFRLVDVRLTFARPVFLRMDIERSMPGEKVAIRPARPGDLPVLQEIARLSHRDTRFFADPNFPPTLAEALYKTWIQVSCQGYADQVFVADRDRIPSGYITCQLGSDRTGRIGLLGVSDRVRGQGLGTSLFYRALDWFARQGTEEVAVVTQEKNRSAQRLYQKCGFTLKSRETWYHKWYGAAEVTRG